MSRSELPPNLPSKQVAFFLQAQEPHTELCVIDSSLTTVARGMWRIEGQLPPGIYRARASLGRQMQEQYLILSNQQSISPVIFSRFKISSPAPLDDTPKASEYHRDAAETESRAHHLALGKGGELFVFARDWENPGRTLPPELQSVGSRLSLFDARGKKLTNFAGVGRQGPAQNPVGPFYACNATVSPGTYYLHLRTAASTLVRSLFVPAGWQLQVFLLQEDPAQRGADAEPASITAFLVPIGAGFQANSTLLRLSECVRRRFAEPRLPEYDYAENCWLDDAWLKSPMYGLYLGYMILGSKNQDRELLLKLIRQLRGVIKNHPDVEVLALAIGDSEVALSALALPPMLLASWTILVEHSLKQPDLIKPGSLGAQLAHHLWGAGPWLVWTDSEPPARTRSVRGRPDQIAAELQRLQSLPELSDFEQALIDQLRPKPMHPLLERLAGKQPSLNSSSTDSISAQLARNLRVPTATIDETMENLLRRSRHLR